MYKILGADGKEYGPVPADTIREWISQGRANSQTLAALEGGPWRTLETFPEFADPLRSAAPPPISPVYLTPATDLPKNNFVVIGLTLSALGFLCCGPLTSIPGVILSSIGLYQLHQNPGAYSTRKGLAWTGIVLGLAVIIIFLLFIALGGSGRFLEMLDEQWKNR